MSRSATPDRSAARDDPFGTAELRRQVLDAWRDSPARFRADANLADDLALVGYRDRVVVELVQNAADAATRAGVSGRLELRLVGDQLIAANTGAPLDAAGVESIAVTRASAKREHDGAVGRFGVGFGAVLAVSDQPRIVSSTGAVRWSLQEARALVTALPELAEELAARDGAVPLLRLPFPSDGQPGDRMTTEVILPLRDETARESVRAQLAALEASVLLSLPSLEEVAVTVDGDRREMRRERRGDLVVLAVDDDVTQWSVVGADGRVDPELLVQLPVEERGNDQWGVVVAIPVTPDGSPTGLPAGTARVVRAPTPTDDPLTLPILLIASYPLDSSRRRVTTGPLADVITDHAADTIVEAILRLPADPRVLDLLPTGVPDGELDAALHREVRLRLQRVAWLPMAAEPGVRQRPCDAVIAPDPLVVPLAEVIPGLLPAGWSRAEVSSLGAVRLSIAELVDAVGAADQPASWWHGLYEGFAAAVPPGPERDALAALPVLLADGSVVTGPRGVALPDDELRGIGLGVLGVRVVHPESSHPLLRALGAVDAGARGLLELPQVQEAIDAAYDEDDPTPVTDAVIRLVAAAGVDSDEMPWLAELALPAAGGGWRAAGELLLPDGTMAALVAPDSGFAIVAEAAVERWGAERLRSVGVLDRPGMVRDLDAMGPDHDLDDEAAWWQQIPQGAAVPDFVAVRDLEQLRDDALPEVLALLAVPPLRAAVIEPAVVVRPDGSSLRVPSYTAWWLSTRPVLAGRVPTTLRLPDAEPVLEGLYDVAPPVVDEEMLRALGVLDSLAAADATDLLTRLADSARVVDRAALRLVYRHLSDRPLTAARRVRAVRDGEVRIVDADRAVVVDAPDLLPLVGSRAVVPVDHAVAGRLAERLAVSLASELAAYPVVSSGERDGDATIHDALLVEDADGAVSEVAWRYVDGELHVDARHRAFGLGRGRAWREGEWELRHRRTEEVIDPAGSATRADEDDLDGAATAAPNLPVAQRLTAR